MDAMDDVCKVSERSREQDCLDKIVLHFKNGEKITFSNSHFNQEVIVQCSEQTEDNVNRLFQRLYARPNSGMWDVVINIRSFSDPNCEV